MRPMPPRSAAYAVVQEVVKQFPNAPALTLAKKLFREHPALWPTLELCRSAVRRALGVNGDHNRRKTVDKTQFRPARQAGDWGHVIPPALVELPDWKAEVFPGPFRCLVLSDIHIPYHDPGPLEAALEYGQQNKATMILLNGDICDFFALSRFEKDPRQRDFAGEVKATRHFLAGLRKEFPKAQIVYRWGNHEERYDKYLWLKAPEFLDLEDFDWSNVFSLNKHKITLVRDKRVIELGKLNVIHGHEFSFQISSPVNPARGFFLRAKTHVLGSHFHRTSQHSERSLEQQVLSAWSTACLCNLHPAWRPINEWNSGLAFVTVDKDGSFEVDNLRIIKNRVFR